MCRIGLSNKWFVPRAWLSESHYENVVVKNRGRALTHADASAWSQVSSSLTRG